jgi:hypothetical protein
VCATLGYPDEQVSRLDGDHIQIVRYDSEDDPNYQKVLKMVALVIEKILSRDSTKKTPDS